VSDLSLKIYIQDNDQTITAFYIQNGSVIWMAVLAPQSDPHGMTFDDGVIYAPTSRMCSKRDCLRTLCTFTGGVIALNASNGDVIWNTTLYTDLGAASPPLVWGDIILMGSTDT
jgi:outer membrane protein assembly factor BamB